MIKGSGEYKAYSVRKFQTFADHCRFKTTTHCTLVMYSIATKPLLLLYFGLVKLTYSFRLVEEGLSHKLQIQFSFDFFPLRLFSIAFVRVGF